MLGLAAAIVWLTGVLEPANGQTSAVTACDRLAASSYDDNAVAEPVTWFALQRNSVAAIKACRAAIIKDSTNPRFKYQLARALDAAEEYEDAAMIYESLVDDPYPAALADLASLYMSGSGVPQNWDRAYLLADQAAKTGNLRGLTVLGVYHVLAPGTTDENRAKGVGFLLEAATKEFGEAMEVLGDFYSDGGALETDEAAALEWNEKAARKGRIRAAFNAGRILYKDTESHDRAFYWFQLASRTGYVPAMIYVANMQLRGDGTDENVDEALAWLERAADAGDAVAVFSLGRVYETGANVEQNFALAKKWYERGVMEGDAGSAYRLARGYDEGEFGKNPPLVIDYLVFAALSGYESALKALLTGLSDGRWSDDSRKALQSRLASEGLYDGEIDGIIEPGVLNAVRTMLTP